MLYYALHSVIRIWFTKIERHCTFYSLQSTWYNWGKVIKRVHQSIISQQFLSSLRDNKSSLQYKPFCLILMWRKLLWTVGFTLTGCYQWEIAIKRRRIPCNVWILNFRWLAKCLTALVGGRTTVRGSKCWFWNPGISVIIHPLRCIRSHAIAINIQCEHSSDRNVSTISINGTANHLNPGCVKLSNRPRWSLPWNTEF